MKIKPSSVIAWVLAIAILPFAILSSRAQSTNIVVYNFNTADQVNGTLAPYTDAWGNWYGTAYYQVLWSSSDANNNPSSGSMEIMNFFPDSGIGGCCGPQFVAYDQNNGVQDVLGGTPLNGNGSTITNFVVTNVTFDIRFDPSSTDTNANGTYPDISVFTRGTGYGQNSFGSVSGISTTNTNWIHMSFTVGPNDNWATIPNIGFSHYSATETGSLNVFVDNIAFQEGTVAIAPPTISIQKPNLGLRIFAGSSINTYDREQLTSIDHNQSWVGGTYPVSYSYTLKSFPTIPAGSVFRFHIFLVPTNSAPSGQGFVGNEYIEYNASNDLWLNVSATNPTNVVADVSWKTNLTASNPNNTALLVTNSTAVGTWTLTFNSATSGTLTPPGGSAQAFNIPAAAAALFANPLVAFFGVQPDSGYGEGQYVDVTKISTAGVASPGVAINDDFTADTSINTNIWDVSNSAQPSSVVLVTSNSPWWVYWTFPDFGFGLGTKADLGNTSIPWKTPYYFANYVTNGTPIKMGNKRWILLNESYLPTASGLSNGVPAANAFFRLSDPVPAQ
jgi:hypothetical protein